MDGQVWTYCHLAYLDPAVMDGVSLGAGTQIGLVGSTGHATGPHLHLQLQPATFYPQDQPWFQSFAGSAFRWQDSPTDLELPDAMPPSGRVFSVVPNSRDAVIGFTNGGA
jgi:murein DD-endopeptidase MepM/ murein hydrolase activator NlpD